MTSWPSPASPRPRPRAVSPSDEPPREEPDRPRPDGSIVGDILYLVVLVCVGAGVYLSWHQGSAGGGKGGVIGGIVLLVAALIRLVLPARFAGLLGPRKRVTDVLTLTIFGTGLLVAGLVLPR
jgi:Protein of unknown function (DUF3017)